MTAHPKIKLSEIRRIGWRDWDPIDLSDGSDFGPANCADEYDRYLLHVVSLLTRGASRLEATAYLDEIAADHMGLGVVEPNGSRRTVDGIAQYLRRLPDSPQIAD